MQLKKTLKKVWIVLNENVSFFSYKKLEKGQAEFLMKKKIS